MNLETQRAKAEAFRAMHDRSKILVLPNAWDPMSARVIEEAGTSNSNNQRRRRFFSRLSRWRGDAAR